MKFAQLLLLPSTLLLLLPEPGAALFTSLQQFKDEWKSLPPPEPAEVDALTGFYRASIKLLTSFPPIIRTMVRFVLNIVWRGVEFDNTDNTATLRFLLSGPETGTLSYSNTSTHDGSPCVRVDLGNRFYEGRFRDNGDILNIVTFTDGSFESTDGISDVHVLFA